jgi:hypothetical protein
MRVLVRSPIWADPCVLGRGGAARALQEAALYARAACLARVRPAPSDRPTCRMRHGCCSQSHSDSGGGLSSHRAAVSGLCSCSWCCATRFCMPRAARARCWHEACLEPRARVRSLGTPPQSRPFTAPVRIQPPGPCTHDHAHARRGTAALVKTRHASLRPTSTAPRRATQHASLRRPLKPWSSHGHMHACYLRALRLPTSLRRAPPARLGGLGLGAEEALAVLCVNARGLIVFAALVGMAAGRAGGTPGKGRAKSRLAAPARRPTYVPQHDRKGMQLAQQNVPP